MIHSIFSSCSFFVYDEYQSIITDKFITMLKSERLLLIVHKEQSNNKKKRKNSEREYAYESVYVAFVYMF